MPLTLRYTHGISNPLFAVVAPRLDPVGHFAPQRQADGCHFMLCTGPVGILVN
jgi:hypothetical protein